MSVIQMNGPSRTVCKHDSIALRWPQNEVAKTVQCGQHYSLKKEEANLKVALVFVT